MSGGSMHYLYRRVEEAEFRDDTPARVAFRQYLILVAKALHDIEWVDSGDYGPGDDEAAIRACIGDRAMLDGAIAHAQNAAAALKAELDRATTP